MFPEDHDLSLGVFGYAGTRHATAALLGDDLDVLLILGSGLNEWFIMSPTHRRQAVADYTRRSRSDNPTARAARFGKLVREIALARREAQGTIARHVRPSRSRGTGRSDDYRTQGRAVGRTNSERVLLSQPAS